MLKLAKVVAQAFEEDKESYCERSEETVLVGVVFALFRSRDRRSSVHPSLDSVIFHRSVSFFTARATLNLIRSNFILDDITANGKNRWPTEIQKTESKQTPRLGWQLESTIFIGGARLHLRPARTRSTFRPVHLRHPGSIDGSTTDRSHPIHRTIAQEPRRNAVRDDEENQSIRPKSRPVRNES